MKRILYVPGKNPKPPATPHREQLLRCLLHGLRRVDAGVAREIETSGAFSLVAWNYLYYRRNHDIAEDIPWIDHLLATESPGNDDHPTMQARHYRAAKLMYQFADAANWLIPLIPDPRIRSFVRDTTNYFSNHERIASRIREKLKHSLRQAVSEGEHLLLIAHSMGSIIAYDALWELHHVEGFTHCVDCLLTIGSPLGMRYVQKRLAGHDRKAAQRYPGNIRRWVNIAAHGDLVALDPRLADDFGEMLEQHCIESIEDIFENIYNHYRDEKGLNVHKSYGYLVNPEVDGVIARWWRQA